MRTLRRSLFAGVLAVLAACGGGGGGDDGPSVIDFEDRPDDGFLAILAPVALAPGVTITDVFPDGELMDFTTADGWGLGCGAEATSGDFMMGVNSTVGVMTITFSPPVLRVEVFASASDGEDVALEAFGAGGVSLGISASQTSACPSLRTDDFLAVDAGSNVIVSVEIRGEYVVIDDLTYSRD